MMPVHWQAQAALRKVAREQEEEDEDPDKVYKDQDDTGHGQRKGKGRGRGGKGRGRGRGRSGRGKKDEQTVEEKKAEEKVEEQKVEENENMLGADAGDNSSPTSTVSKLPNEPMIALRRSQSKRRVLKRAKSNKRVDEKALALKRLKSTAHLHASPPVSAEISPETGNANTPESEVPNPKTDKSKHTTAKTKPCRRVSDQAGHNEEQPPCAESEGKRRKLEDKEDTKGEHDKKVKADQDHIQTHDTACMQSSKHACICMNINMDLKEIVRTTVQ